MATKKDLFDEQTSNDEVEIGTPFARLRAKGTDTIIVLTFIIVVCSSVISGFLLWEHKRDAGDGERALAQAIKELSETTRRGNRAQREMNCLISLPQERREAEFNQPNGLCKRLTRDE